MSKKKTRKAAVSPLATATADAKFPKPAPALAAFALLALFATLSVWEMWDDSATFDERAHIPAGYAYWKAREFSLNTEHPPLVKLLAALPLLPMELKLPPTKPEDWPGERGTYQWRFGSEFLFSQDADTILFRARLPIVALGLLLGILIFSWSSLLHGNRTAGLISLFLFALEPTIIAHSHYVTTDVALATFGTMAFFYTWRYAREGKWRDLFLASGGLGLALAAKFTAVVFVPVFFILLGLAVWERGKRLGSGTLAAELARSGLAASAIAAIIVQASYLFSPDPLLYFRGLRSVALEQNVGYFTYVNGSFYQGGVWWYPLNAFILKTPIPTLAAMMIGTALCMKPRSRPAGVLFLLLPTAAYALALCSFAPNMGNRYMIPVTAFLLVLAGGCCSLLETRRGRIVMGLFALWLAASVLRVSPHHIAYFNELIGGPANGARYLDDSNLDWGQDLKRLMKYLHDKNLREVFLSYWGSSPPEHYAKQYGIRLSPLTAPAEANLEPTPGTYAISVNHLVGLKRLVYATFEAPPTVDWLSRFEPIDRVGYSIYIYRFPAQHR